MSIIVRGLFVGALLATLALGAITTAQAQDEPEDEFSEVSVASSHYVRARIGYRKSLSEGERSTFKWLSRLIKEEPKETSFMVEWQTRQGGKKISILMSYDSTVAQLTRLYLFSNKPLKVGTIQMLPTHQEVWAPVSIQEIHSLAKRSGTVASLKLLK